MPTWNNSDWDNPQSETGVHHEQQPDTDWAGEAVIEKGYPSEDEGGDKLMGYWPLDEGPGATTAHDVSQNGFDADINNANVDRSGVLGRTDFEFDGSDDDVRIPQQFVFEIDNSPEQTWSVWARPVQADGEWQGVITKNRNSQINGIDDAWWIGLWRDPTGTKWHWRTGEDGWSFSNSSDYTVGDWHHFVVTVDKNAKEKKAYLNGTKYGPRDFSGKELKTPGGGANLDTHIGRAPLPNNVGSEWFEGDIGEVRLYNRVVSDEEAQDLYEAVAGTSTYWTSKKPETEPLNRVALVAESTVPSGTSIYVTVYEDVGADDGSTTDGLGNSYDNESRRVRLNGGTDEVAGLPELDGVDTSQTNEYWLKIELTNDDEDPTLPSPTLSSVAVVEGKEYRSRRRDAAGSWLRGASQKREQGNVGSWSPAEIQVRDENGNWI